MAKLKLYMGLPLKGDSGIARLNAKTMAELKVKEGDTVSVVQQVLGPPPPPLFKVARSLAEDENKNIIRVGEEDFKKHSYKPDEKTVVSPF